MPEPLGCLILHGFTSSLDTVRALVPMAERLGLPYRMPVLRGHGTRPEDLRGVGWPDWYADAESALAGLRNEAEQVVVCGLSVDGLVALHLAVEHPTDVAAVASIATSLRFGDPLVHLAPIIRRVRRMWPWDGSRAFSDPVFAAQSTNYLAFATDAFASLLRYQKLVAGMLPRLRSPLLIVHARHDRIVPPAIAELIYARAGSTQKELRWFERSGHEMLLDCEAGAVVACVEDWISRLPTIQP